ncbi:MAG: retron Ec67 family RNA-directed DNA polymerase/endonuclease [Burkholderiales bacterium]
MSRVADLKAATGLSDVARLLDLKPAMLSFHLYQKPKSTWYTEFEVPKRHGGARKISAPEKTLKLIQHRLSDLLQDCVEELNVAAGSIENAKHLGISHGFKRGRSIISNARPHVARRYVFNVDVHDFFGSINFGRVRNFFIKNRSFALNEGVATVLAQIACHDNKLPQGSPCSPVISNLIGHIMDIYLVRLAAATGCTYSRYADDLTFSSNKRSFPARVASKSDDDEHRWVAGTGLARLLGKSRFSLNEQKTRMQYRDSRQEVTGLTVNKKINVPAEYRYKVRAMVHKLFTTGEFTVDHKKRDQFGVPVLVSSTAGKPRQLMGMLSYIHQVDTFNNDLCEENDREPVEARGRLTQFRRFIYFDAFYAPTSPVILCEGKTDNVYLKCAIKSLALTFPLLASAEQTPKLKVRLFKYGDRPTSKITAITGGVGGLCNMMKNYQSDLVKFKGPAPKHPVILLIDNDAGAHSVYGAVVGIASIKKPSGAEPFIHVFGNLYVVPTPLGNGGTQTSIEDFFDQSTLDTLLDGKKFDPTKEKDNTTHYGKAAFARDVVAAKADTTNFKGFVPILDRVNDVLVHYAAYVGAAAPVEGRWP